MPLWVLGLAIVGPGRPKTTRIQSRWIQSPVHPLSGRVVLTPDFHLCGSPPFKVNRHVRTADAFLELHSHDERSVAHNDFFPWIVDQQIGRNP